MTAQQAAVLVEGPARSETTQWVVVADSRCHRGAQILRGPFPSQHEADRWARDPANQNRAWGYRVAMLHRPENMPPRGKIELVAS